MGPNNVHRDQNFVYSGGGGGGLKEIYSLYSNNMFVKKKNKKW